MIIKICTICGNIKDINLFVTKNKSIDGHASECKECHNKRHREYYRRDLKVSRERGRERTNEYYKRYPEKHKESTRKRWREQTDIVKAINKKSYIKRREEDPEYFLKRRRNYNANNKDKVRQWSKNYSKKHRLKLNSKAVIRRKENPEIRLRHNLRNRIRIVLKGLRKGGNLYELVGCDVATLKKHLESQFTNGMAWDTYGVGKGKWSIDHIIPLERFTLSIIEQQKIAFHYINLRPLLSLENSSKGSLYNGVRIYKKNK